VAEAVFCGVLILVVNFFMTFALQRAEGLLSFARFARITVVTQLVVVATPALLMTVFFTSSFRQTLLLRRPPWLAIPAAGLLAVALHPAANALQVVVTQLYPVREDMRAALETAQQMFVGAPFWGLVLVMALLPAVCEELAFRGFILSGLRHLGHPGRAIVYSALFFGITHGILQQSLITCLVGLVIAYVVIHSGSILPGMVFHVLHNTLTVAMARVTPAALDRWPVLGILMSAAEGDGHVYHWPVMAGGAVAAALLLAWFARLPYAKSPEEQFQETIHRGSSGEPLAAAQQNR
jgi:sodium transport system permease protein